MIPFRRELQLGDEGSDVHGVNRALARAGHGKLPEAGPLMNPYHVAALEAFQRAHKLTVDGIYGPGTHAALGPSFDSYARSLYAEGPPAKPTLQLPQVFKATHVTAGLPGYPAVDVFAKAGTIALSPADGIVDQLSGHQPTGSAKPGGPYGLSCYVKRAGGGRYYLTHFGALEVKVGDRVKRGQRLGPLVDWEAAAKAWNRQHGGSTVTPSHIHEGFNARA